MHWELPPTSIVDCRLEHYYHYPGVTLGIHRVNEKNTLRYERIFVNAENGNKTTKVFDLSLPDIPDSHSAIRVAIGCDNLIITHPEKDNVGRNVYVTVLFYESSDLFEQDNCGSVCHHQNIFNQDTHQPTSSLKPIGRRVHFAPLAAVRYISQATAHYPSVNKAASSTC